MLNRENIMAMNKQKSSLLKFARQGRAVQRGVVLLEAMVAILLFSMGVLALVGLQAAMIKNTSDSKFRADASYIAQQWIGRMWADPTNLGGYLIPDNTNIYYDISADLPNGVRIVTQPDSTNFPNLFMLTIKWQQPGQAQHNYTTTFNIAP
jgi:type IV pilus assembly protein PilV